MSSKYLTISIAALSVSILLSTPASAGGGGDPLTRWLDQSLRKESMVPSVGTDVSASAADAAADAARGIEATKKAPEAVARSRQAPENGRAAIERLNAYFNGIGVLTANFVQTNADGRKVSGTLMLKRPGEFRFAYAAPSTLEIVSDGRKVAIRDSRLRTNDVYPLDQTPLKFLVKDRFDIAKDTKVTDVKTERDGTIRVSFEDGATFGGTSRVELTFDASKDSLKDWTLTDPQGYRTVVTLSDIVVRESF